MNVRPITVIIVAYGRPDLLERTLSGLDGAFPVRIVDNSSDTAVEAVAQCYGAHYTDPGINRGFGAGVNVAIRSLLTGAPTEVLLLNPDAVMEPEAIRRLATRVHQEGDAGMATPTIVHGNGEKQRAIWPFPTPGRMWLEAVGLGRLSRAQDFAVGTALLLRWEAIQQVGLFDESFFLYAEETDWQRRARDHGFRAIHVREAIAQHVGAATSSNPRRREELFHAGTETYVRKWHGAMAWQGYRAAAIVGGALRGTLLRGERGVAARARARLYARGPGRSSNPAAP